MEILVVIGIVMTLAGILAPVLLASKRRAAETSELNNMHQLAVAQGIYTGDTGYVPLSPAVLVEGHYAPETVCSSALDNTLDGIGNLVAREDYAQMGNHPEAVSKFRNSYPGLREFCMPYEWIDKYIKDNPTAGWLVSIASVERRDKSAWIGWYEGSYHRLVLDGSVQTHRVQPVYLSPGGGGDRAEHNFFLFVDGTDEWKRKFISGSR
ncbi:hypothetical protein OP10G_2027 [Fimbriimonas ginsengisoli Gsoil 348]|uniref:Type II secretion system protein n=1 Tax=Fimbriimonas ginsengisoli Gsoil 348 TaxID=661478 RepID=A0A068NRK0_FIMGI|nr:hypothetical protein OP10G_2027 [Fimbriimonas ginsengisoli Gsoil 348]